MLKSVYFGFMELKVLVYIVIGIIWLFSKLLNTKEQKKKTPVLTQPQPVPVPVAPPVRAAPVKKKLPVRATKAAPAPVNRSVSLESQTGLEAAAVDRLNRNVLTNRNPDTVLGEVQRIEEDEWQANGSYGSQIASEIKNGTIDWKRAVVINELLRQRV